MGAKDALAKATALRKKEASIFAKDSSDTKTNIAAMGKAIAALEKGAGGSFLQTSASATLKRLTINMDMSSADRDMLTSFLTSMQEKVTAEGKKEEELFEQFMCYCKSGSGDLKKSISAAEEKIAQDTSSLEAAESLNAQLKKDLTE